MRETRVGTRPAAGAGRTTIRQKADTSAAKGVKHAASQRHAAAQRDQYLRRNPSRAEISAELDQVAAKYGIPPQYLKAIAEMESGWRQFDAKGNVVRGETTPHDQGIMQINEDAHPDAFPKAREDYIYNINYGASYLHDEYEQYHDWDKAIAAYNYGSARYKHGSHDKFVNQPYVDRVMRLSRKFEKPELLDAQVKTRPDNGAIHT